MVCRELEQFLHPYLDGEFDAGESSELESHLSTCVVCTKAADEERALREKIRSSLQGVKSMAPESLRHSVEQGLVRETRRAAVISWSRLGALAAMAAALGGTVFYLREDPSRRFVEAAAARHARGLPFEIQNPSHEGAEAWFGGKLLHRVAVPRFPNAVLAGARLTNVTDKEAAYLSYETDAPNHTRRRMGLFVFQDDDLRVNAQPLPAIAVANTHGYNVALWREGEIVYELVTDLDENDIRQMLRPAPASPMLPATSPGLSVQPASFSQ
jgi:anti-sigma factor RsiW